MVGRTTVSSSGSTGSESFVLIWVHFLNSVGCRFNNQRRGVFFGGVRPPREPPRAPGHACARRVARRAPWLFTCSFGPLCTPAARWPPAAQVRARLVRCALWAPPPKVAAPELPPSGCGQHEPPWPRQGRPQDFTISILTT